MTILHDDVVAAIDAVEILSPGCFRLLGEHVDPGRQGQGSPRPTDGPIDHVERLATELYQRIYLRLLPHPRIWPDAIARRDFLSSLTVANAGHGSWTPGWTVRRVGEDGRIVVIRHDIEWKPEPEDIRVAPGPIRPGDRCRVRVPRESRRRTPAFYVGFGDEEDDAEGDEDSVQLLRYYWHLTAGAAVPFVAAATSLLNAEGIPFSLKVPNDPDGYIRADAGVLFLSPRHRGRGESVIGEVYRRVASGLRPTVPRFTRRLADGLGFAECPPWMSFGDERCRLIAAALWRAFDRGERDREARIAAVTASFLEAGLDPARPHLRPGRRDVESPTIAIRPVNAPALRRMSPIEAARRIGQDLCRVAHWDRDGRLCNWIGRSPSEIADPSGSISPILSALDVDVYGGSAGVALFLARLHRLTGIEEFRRTAIGGIGRSIELHSRSPDRLSPLSFFLGALGVGYAALRIAAELDHPELFDRAGHVLERAIRPDTSPPVLDVIEGHAGAIPVLLELGREPGWRVALERAVALGEELIRTEAGRTRHGDLAARSGLDAFDLSGLAHGASGIGLAWLELHATTGRVDFLDASRRLFDREARLFDEGQGNWASGRPEPDGPEFQIAWCEGAAGIALSRLRAAALDSGRRDEYLAAARVGIARTLNAMEWNLASPRCDASPCHGLSGLIEIVAIAGRILDESSYRDRALAAARSLIDRHGEPGDWPSGLPAGGPNPSIMAGTAGIGYTFLRLHDPEQVPSLLWIGA